MKHKLWYSHGFHFRPQCINKKIKEKNINNYNKWVNYSNYY